MTANAEVQPGDVAREFRSGYRLLQMLVGIRLRSVTDPESRRHLSWLSDVTAAMALLDRRMPDQGSVDFAGYLEDAAEFWRRARQGRPLRIDLRASPTPAPVSHVLPMAIVVHELVSNAVRHAFPDNRRGSIAIAWSPASDGVSLVVRDSGVGAEHLVFGDGPSLVVGLVEHLGGAMTIETAPGAGVGVRIRLPIRPETTH